MRHLPAKELKVGDVVMPPPRELQLWMRRVLQERGLSESALHLTITEIREGTPDKRGKWLVVMSSQSPEWHGNTKPYPPFKFKVRPETPWGNGVNQSGLAATSAREIEMSIPKTIEIDEYRVLPHRDVLDCTMYSAATGQPIGDYEYEHKPCGISLTCRQVVEENWCGHCAATINKAAQRRGRAASRNEGNGR